MFILEGINNPCPVLTCTIDKAGEGTVCLPISVEREYDLVREIK
jgi:hypothetical protein